MYNECEYYVLADELLADVFSNIIGNSVKYAGRDCRIEITTEEKNGKIEVCIDDNGPGMPDDAKEKAFGRLFREKIKESKATGKGLGLYIVKSLVKRYGGEIMVSDVVEDKPEKGLKVCITFKKSAEPGSERDFEPQN